MHMRFAFASIILVATSLLSACIGGSKGTASGSTPPPPVLNTMTVTVDSGPAAATGAINHPYVTVKVCVPDSTTQCATIDHVLLDTGSWGLRLVRSVLTAGAVTLSPETDSQGHAIEECATFGSGQTWGPVALADVTLAGEVAAKVPVQILDDTGAAAPPPSTCGASGSLVNGVVDWSANGLLGVGVFAQDCGAACVNASTPLAMYYGCTTAGVCTAENVVLTAQVTNPVTLFPVDNNGIIVNMPNLLNANGDSTLQGELTFGLATQMDNPLPMGLTVLGADSHGDFTATYNGGTTALPAWIDSGNDSYALDDPTIAVCTSAAWVGYYCPAIAPLSLFAVNSGVGVNNATDTVQFAISDPNSFVANASAFDNLGGGGGSTTFTWGMPFFYGRKIYIGIDQKVSGSFTGPFYAY
jgi:hypothetical protein